MEPKSVATYSETTPTLTDPVPEFCTESSVAPAPVPPLLLLLLLLLPLCCCSLRWSGSFNRTLRPVVMLFELTPHEHIVYRRVVSVTSQYVVSVIAKFARDTRLQERRRTGQERSTRAIELPKQVRLNCVELPGHMKRTDSRKPAEQLC